MDLAAPLAQREWLETNALGGFAASTASGIHTRRYHGLLIAAQHPPGQRVALLSQLDETLVINGQRYELGAHQYPGVVHPRGFEYLTGFSDQPFPTWRYEIGDAVLEKSLFLVDGQNTLVVEYRLTGAAKAQLEIRPLVAFRDVHSLPHENAAFRPLLETAGPAVLALKPYPDQPALYFGHNAESIVPSGHWYRDFEYAIERERGLDCVEDLNQPFVLQFQLDHAATLVVATEPHTAAEAEGFRASESARRAQWKTPLQKAADQFLVRRAAGGWTVIAGYPWFTDWGRDTMIALPGLMLATGRHDAARDVLAGFAQSVSQGMLPNWFPEQGRPPEFNTIDASLWLFEAAQFYLDATGDRLFVERELYPALTEIVRWHLRGMRYGIRVDDDGLLAGGEEGVQLTWMDAKVGDHVITPRHGKPVEIQALWYNALRILQNLASLFGEPVARIRCAELADWAVLNFEPLFWNREAGCLFDVVDGQRADASIRPNQVFALSLTHPLLTGDRAHQVLAIVERELLTPMGLRSLAPSSLAYRARYEGTVAERDGAYHQGTVWPWLIGPFVRAYLRAHGDSTQAQAQARQWLQPLAQRIEATGQLCEIADGDAPHRDRGCPAQAWSVAEFARAWATATAE